jgi:hypothetical protein
LRPIGDLCADGGFPGTLKSCAHGTEGRGPVQAGQIHERKERNVSGDRRELRWLD